MVSYLEYDGAVGRTVYRIRTSTGIGITSASGRGVPGLRRMGGVLLAKAALKVLFCPLALAIATVLVDFSRSCYVHKVHRVHTDPGYNRGGFCGSFMLLMTTSLAFVLSTYLITLFHAAFSLFFASPEYHLALLEDSTMSTGRLVDWGRLGLGLGDCSDFR